MHDSWQIITGSGTFDAALEDSIPAVVSYQCYFATNTSIASIFPIPFQIITATLSSSYTYTVNHCQSQAGGVGTSCSPHVHVSVGSTHYGTTITAPITHIYIVSVSIWGLSQSGSFVEIVDKAAPTAAQVSGAVSFTDEEATVGFVQGSLVFGRVVENGAGHPTALPAVTSYNAYLTSECLSPDMAPQTTVLCSIHHTSNEYLR